jgi:hypothetical protein
MTNDRGSERIKKKCQNVGEEIELIHIDYPSMWAWVCSKGMPVKDACKNNDCIFHNVKAMHISGLLTFDPNWKKSIQLFTVNRSLDEYKEMIKSSVGGKDYSEIGRYQCWK